MVFRVSIVMTATNGCLLCGGFPEEGMHIMGQKKIKGAFVSYQLCRDCCLSSSGLSEDGVPSRRKVWEKVETTLLKNIKTNKGK
jgi:hypothetical protein